MFVWNSTAFLFPCSPFETFTSAFLQFPMKREGSTADLLPSILWLSVTSLRLPRGILWHSGRFFIYLFFYSIYFLPPSYKRLVGSFGEWATYRIRVIQAEAACKIWKRFKTRKLPFEICCVQALAESERTGLKNVSANLFSTVRRCRVWLQALAFLCGIRMFSCAIFSSDGCASMCALEYS